MLLEDGFDFERIDLHAADIDEKFYAAGDEEAVAGVGWPRSPVGKWPSMNWAGSLR